MNILQIANKAIYPPDGGSLAILSSSKGYIQKGHRVHLLNMITHKHSNDATISEEEYKDSLTITGIQMNTKVSFFSILINFVFSKKPLISNRFYSQEFEEKLRSLLKNNAYDFIQLEGLYVFQYITCIRQNFKGKVVYRSHNIEHLIWKRNFHEAKSFLKKIYFRSLYKRLKRLEESYLNTYDYLLPITDSDASIYQQLGNTKPVKVSPFGIDLKNIHTRYIKPDGGHQEQAINYIGALDWIPNQEGLIWFIESCFPIIVETFPEIKLNIAGRNAPNWLIKKLNRENIHFLGEVDDAYAYIQKQGPIIVPLFSGSGMRVKIIECMALKKAIVATSIAAEGIHCLHNENILLADHPEDFAKSVILLLNNVDLQHEIGANASVFIEKHFDFIQIATDILNFIK